MALEFVIYPSIAFLELGCPGAKASVSGDIHALSVEEGILVSLPSRLGGHIAQCHLSELLRESNCDMILGLLTYSHPRDVDWNRCELS